MVPMVSAKDGAGKPLAQARVFDLKDVSR